MLCLLFVLCHSQSLAIAQPWEACTDVRRSQRNQCEMSAVSPLNPRVGEWGGGRGVGEERETSFNCSPLSLLTVVWWGVGGGEEETPEADFTHNTS